MFTLSVEATGVNASIQTGPAVIGAGVAGGKGFGLRSGGVGTYDFAELNVAIFGGKALILSEKDRYRGKGYDCFYRWFPWEDDEDEFDIEMNKGKWFNSWQFECTANVGVGARADFNFAEVLDFVLGWTTLDICDDDVSEKIQKLEEFIEKTQSDDEQNVSDSL